MDCNATRIPYRQTHAFSKTILDYLDHAGTLRPFYQQPPTIQGIRETIAARKTLPLDRTVLTAVLRKQYATIKTTVATEKNIEALEKNTGFTITTAHQPNIFTGPLYFIYKILHTLRLAENCKTLLPGYDFVPVYYMGSEDADLDELGHFYIDGDKRIWNTKQTGAVGRMKVDKQLIQLIANMEGQLSVLPHGPDVLNTIKECYTEGTTIQDATFKLVNTLFGDYGLVVLLPDSPVLKKQAKPVFEDELLHQTASGIVEQTAKRLEEAGYKVQAHPREINLFYLKDSTRERIETRNEKYIVVNTAISFTKEEILAELEQHPERFSPNVILRGIYQETILPNIAFVGGGGETAYWLQYKDLFAHYNVSFPVLVLRNSFLIIEKKWQEKIAKLHFTPEDLFLPERDLMNKLVTRDSENKLRFNGTLTETEQLYNTIKKQASAIDRTLEKHVEALKTNTLYRLQELEKKMLRAEKRKFSDQQRQIQVIRERLFPNNGLQERVDNFLPYYAKWGKDFIAQLYSQSQSLEQEMVVLIEQ